MINKDLIKERGIGVEVENKIIFYQQELDALLKKPMSFCSERSEVVNQIEALEYVLQALWGFDLDSKFHKHWRLVSGCTCPELDNQDLYGTKFRTIRSTCPFHYESLEYPPIEISQIKGKHNVQ